MVYFPYSEIIKQMTQAGKQMTEDRKQKSDMVFHLSVFLSVFCRLTSVF